ncbi:MAG: hypothetical protein JNK82_28120 [Myxococcaceae bacterium]|nr:hypothetical protein [Myxococcaceae bacterium]
MISLFLLAVLSQTEPTAAPTPTPDPAPPPEAAPAADTTTVAPTTAEVKVEAPPEPPPKACARWRNPALMEGPAFVGYAEADLAIGRRSCPRSEVGIGGDFGAIIDTPNFYGDVGAQALIYGSWAINPKTEVFALIEAFDFQYTVNAVISGTQASLGNATIGAARQLFEGDVFADAISVRVLLPTASNIPGTRNIGAEIGHSLTVRAASFLELHAFGGVGFTVGLGPAPLPAINAVVAIGAALTPVSWFSFVLDMSGGIAGRSFLAPTAALRFRVYSVGIELAATRPIAGNDRNTAIGALRVAYRF